MNLSKLFETQKLLDNRIVDEHNLHGQDLLPQKILALQVELAELAQNWRGFKFWSRDQEPRTFEWVGKCEKCNGHGVDDENISCPNCAGTGDGNKNPLLEEYADCLHFILSIGNELNFDQYKHKYIPIQKDSIIEQFIFINTKAGTLSFFKAETDYNHIIQNFLGLGEMLGFTWSEIEQSYYEKNAINHTRQDNSY